MPFPANEENCQSGVLSVYFAVALSLVLVASTWDEKKKVASSMLQFQMLYAASGYPNDKKWQKITFLNAHLWSRIQARKKRWRCLQSRCALVPYCLGYKAVMCCFPLWCTVMCRCKFNVHLPSVCDIQHVCEIVVIKGVAACSLLQIPG